MLSEEQRDALSGGFPTPSLSCYYTSPSQAGPRADYLLKRRVDWPSVPYVILGEALTSVVPDPVSGLPAQGRHR